MSSMPVDAVAPVPDAAPVAPATPAPRTGGALFRATKDFAVENLAKSYRLLVISFLATVALQLVVFALPWWPLKAVASVFVGLSYVRLFIFVHDEAHGAIFRDSAPGRWACNAIGMWLLTPPSVWKETHDYHHRNNAKMTGASIGSYPTITTRMWAFAKDKDKRAYTIARHPVTIALGYVTIFAIGMCISPFRRAPKEHWTGPVALILHIALVTLAFVFAGWQVAVFNLMLPAAVAKAAGSYLFYAQHNFPDVVLKDRKEWNYSFAAVNSSSMFDMSPWMHWLTGNIGYHHVHHLNHRIPFYNLPAAMDAIPELQNPGRTSWSLRDISACLRLKLWDPAQQKMVPFPTKAARTA